MRSIKPKKKPNLVQAFNFNRLFVPGVIGDNGVAIAMDLLRSGTYEVNEQALNAILGEQKEKDTHLNTEFRNRIKRYHKFIRVYPPNRFLSVLPNGKVAIRLNGDYLLGSEIEISDMDRKVCERRFPVRSSPITEGRMTHFIALPDGKMVYGESFANNSSGWPNVYWRDFIILDASGKVIDAGQFSSKEKYVVSMASISNDRVAYGFSDGTVEIRKITSGRQRFESSFKAHTSSVTALLGLPDGSLISVDKKTINLWDAQRNCVNTFSHGHRAPVTDLMLSPHRGLISVSIESREMKIWDVFPLTPAWLSIIREKFCKQWSELLDKAKNHLDGVPESLLFDICHLLENRKFDLKDCMHQKNLHVLALWKRTQELFEKKDHPKPQHGTQCPYELFKTRLAPIQFEMQQQVIEDFRSRYHYDYTHTLFGRSRLPEHATWDEIIRHGMEGRTSLGFRNRTYWELHKIMDEQGLIGDVDQLSFKNSI